MNAYPNIPLPAVDADPTLALLLEQLQARHNNAICCTLVYGSCLRSGDIYDGLLDLYLICDDYRTAYRNPLTAAGNWVLPPNVFYAEQTLDDKILRSKVTVISLRDFKRGCSPAWLASYIWGRFAQPTHILYSRNAGIREEIEEALLQAARTLLLNSVPALPERGAVTDLWQQALSLSYTTELRSEYNGRAQELAQSSREFYASMTRYHAGSIGFGFAVYDEGSELQYKSQASRLQQRFSLFKWTIRRGQGKLLSVLRLIKALFTFEGGLDYIAWKLERHTGEKIVIPDRVRRVPLIFLWGFFWDLYRRGLFK